MVGVVATNPKELFAEHLRVLRGYASRVASQGDSLTGDEEQEVKERLREFFAVGGILGLADKEMVLLLYRGVWAVRRGCDCMTCTARRSNG